MTFKFENVAQILTRPKFIEKKSTFFPKVDNFV